MRDCPSLRTCCSIVEVPGSTRPGRPANTTKPPDSSGAPGSRPSFGANLGKAHWWPIFACCWQMWVLLWDSPFYPVWTALPGLWDLRDSDISGAPFYRLLLAVGQGSLKSPSANCTRNLLWVPLCLALWWPTFACSWQMRGSRCPVLSTGGPHIPGFGICGVPSTGAPPLIASLWR
jgi:hypothetical protein